MPLFKTIKVEGGLIAVWHMTEKTSDLIAEFSSDELSNQSFKQYTNEKRQLEWMATRLLLKQLIGPDFSIDYARTGKPILNSRQYKHLSISHSRCFVAIFVHEQLTVGIDIEEQSRNFNAIEKRYLSAAELTAVHQDPKLQCLYWCAKEAIFKLVPDEGVEFREQIHIAPFDPDCDDQFIARFSSESKELVFELHFQLFSEQGLVWVTGQK